VHISEVFVVAQNFFVIRLRTAGLAARSPFASRCGLPYGRPPPAEGGKKVNMVLGFWFLVFGFWFLVFGFWFLVFGFWFLVFSNHIRGIPGTLIIISVCFPCTFFAYPRILLGFAVF
jgi:hypothetical protein